MRLRNVSPDPQFLPGRGVTVPPGEVIEVTDEEAKAILAPGRPWEVVVSVTPEDLRDLPDSEYKVRGPGAVLFPLIAREELRLDRPGEPGSTITRIEEHE